MRIPTTKFEIMTLLHSVDESEAPAKLNPGLTVSQAKKIMIDGIKGMKEDRFHNTSGDILALSNALAVIHNRKTRMIRTEVRKALASA